MKSRTELLGMTPEYAIRELLIDIRDKLFEEKKPVKEKPKKIARKKKDA